MILAEISRDALLEKARNAKYITDIPPGVIALRLIEKALTKVNELGLAGHRVSNFLVVQTGNPDPLKPELFQLHASVLYKLKS